MLMLARVRVLFCAIFKRFTCCNRLNGIVYWIIQAPDSLNKSINVCVGSIALFPMGKVSQPPTTFRLVTLLLQFITCYPHCPFIIITFVAISDKSCTLLVVVVWFVILPPPPQPPPLLPAAASLPSIVTAGNQRQKVVSLTTIHRVPFSLQSCTTSRFNTETAQYWKPVKQSCEVTQLKSLMLCSASV